LLRPPSRVPTAENSVKQKFSLPPPPRSDKANPMRAHNTGRYYQCLMYVGLKTHDTLHKNTLSIGPGLRIMLDADFRELWIGEVRRTLLPRTPVNKGKRKGRSPVGLAPYHSLLVPFSGGRRGLAPSLQCTRRRTQAGLRRSSAGWTHKMSSLRPRTLTAALP